MSPNPFYDLEKKLSGIRTEYHFGKLNRSDLSANPTEQLMLWLNAALKASDPKANIMVLATSAGRKVSTRSVLLKGITPRGLIFYSHSQSRKARELAKNPRASVCFYWPALERQITVAGRTENIPRRQAGIYFHSRPRKAQIAAWCSRQSQVIETREELDKRFEEMRKKFEGREIPLSPFWCGFLLKPEEFEFWQGRANRLNDRFRYRRRRRRWVIERLQP